MLQRNVGTIDRAARLTLAVALFSLFFFLDGAWAWLGLVGLVPLLTGLVGSCPLYSLLGIRTCPLREESA